MRKHAKIAGAKHWLRGSKTNRGWIEIAPGISWNRDFSMGAIILGPVLLGLNWVAQITLRHMQPSTSRILLGTVVALVLGLLLFALKVSAPIIYGIVEGAFAIGSCAFSLSNLTDDRLTGAAFIGLASSIYLMIRAMDNIRKGREESKVRKNKREAAFEEANRRQTELVEKVNELEGPGSIQE